MFTMRKHAVILFLPIFLLTTVTSMSQSKRNSEGTASISGTITVGGRPVRGAIVRLELRSNKTFKSYSAKSDQSGIYRFASIQAGAYEVTVKALPLIFTAGEFRRHKQLIVSDGENVENLNFELSRGGVITGTMTGPNSQPLVETNVQLLQFDDNGKRLYLNIDNYEMARTDDRGAYRIYGLPKGKYKVSIGVNENNNFNPNMSDRQLIPLTFYGDTDDESKAKLIDIDGNTEATNINIQVKEMKRYFQISGRIINIESQAPVAGVPLSIGSIKKQVDSDQQYLSNIWCCSEPTNENGEFKFHSVLPGNYIISERNEYYNSGSKSSHPGYYSKPSIVEVINSDVNGAEVILVRGSVIRGFVIVEDEQNEPASLSKLKISSRPAHYGPLNSSNSVTGDVKPDGSFILNGVEPGKIYFDLHMSLEDHNFQVNRVEYNGMSFSPSLGESIDVVPGANISGIRVVLNKKGSLQLQGEVKIINGKLLDNVEIGVQAINVSNEERSDGESVWVDARGKFLLNNLKEAEYEVSVRSFSLTLDEKLQEKLALILEQAKKTVRVTSGPVQTITFTIDLSSIK